MAFSQAVIHEGRDNNGGHSFLNAAGTEDTKKHDIDFPTSSYNISRSSVPPKRAALIFSCQRRFTWSSGRKADDHTHGVVALMKEI